MYMYIYEADIPLLIDDISNVIDDRLEFLNNSPSVLDCKWTQCS